MKKEKILKYAFLTLFVLFLALYFTQTTGYYEYSNKKRTTFTEEEIKRFEQDIKEGKNLDLEEYLTNQEHDYDNKLSSFGLNLSRKIENAMNKGIEYLFKSIEGVINS